MLQSVVTALEACRVLFGPELAEGACRQNMRKYHIQHIDSAELWKRFCAQFEAADRPLPAEAGGGVVP